MSVSQPISSKFEDGRLGKSQWEGLVSSFGCHARDRTFCTQYKLEPDSAMVSPDII
jgi:hypothetical protein